MLCVKGEVIWFLLNKEFHGAQTILYRFLIFRPQFNVGGQVSVLHSSHPKLASPSETTQFSSWATTGQTLKIFCPTRSNGLAYLLVQLDGAYASFRPA